MELELNKNFFINQVLNKECFPKDIFLDQKTIQKFICPLDHGVYRNPVIDECSHTYGKLCIDKWISEVQKICPVSKKDYASVNFNNNSVIEDFLNDLEVQCLTYKQNCTWQGSIRQLESHLKNECMNVMINCPNQNCTDKIVRKNVENHMKYLCGYQEIQCVFQFKGCEQKLLKKDIGQHISESHFNTLQKFIQDYKDQQQKYINLEQEKSELQKQQTTLSQKISFLENQSDATLFEKINSLSLEKEKIIEEKEAQSLKNQQMQLKVEQQKNIITQLESEIFALQAKLDVREKRSSSQDKIDKLIQNLNNDTTDQQNQQQLNVEHYINQNLFDNQSSAQQSATETNHLQENNKNNFINALDMLPKASSDEYSLLQKNNTQYSQQQISQQQQPYNIQQPYSQQQINNQQTNTNMPQQQQLTSQQYNFLPQQSQVQQPPQQGQSNYQYGQQSTMQYQQQFQPYNVQNQQQFQVNPQQQFQNYQYSQQNQYQQPQINPQQFQQQSQMQPFPQQQSQQYQIPMQFPQQQNQFNQMQAYPILQPQLILNGHTNTINHIISLGLLNQIPTIASCSDDKTIRLWNLVNSTCYQLLQGHIHYVNKLLHLQDQNSLVSSSDDETIRIWDLQSFSCVRIIRQHQGRIKPLLYIPAHGLIVSAGADKKIIIHSIQNKEFAQTIYKVENQIECLAFSLQNKFSVIVVGDKNGFIYILTPEFDKKKQQANFSTMFSSSSQVLKKKKQCHSDVITNVQILDKQQQVLSTSITGECIRIWSYNLELIRELNICDVGKIVNDFLLEQTANVIVTGSSDETLKLINCQNFEVQQTFKKEGCNIVSVGWINETRSIVSAGSYIDPKTSKFAYIIKVRNYVM